MLIVPKAKVMYPMSLEREYARELVRYTKGVTAICYEYLPLMVDEALANGITADRMDNWITDVTEKIREAIDSKLRITDKISAMFNKVKGYAQRQQEKIYRSIFGGTPARPSSRQYEVVKQIWASQNLTLIRSIDNQTLEAIHYALSRNVIRTVDREMLVSELTQTIKHMANVNEKRAALIACDQVGKLNSQLAQYEQFNQGVDSYIWTTMKDNRVRPQHAAREGKRYYWNDPPSDGHPGWPIRCRCIATPVYDTDKMPVQPKRNSYTQVDKNGIIEPRGGGRLEQAKTRDRKIMVTDVAIDKVPYVQIPKVPASTCRAIQDEHKEILRIAMAKNKSDEVLSVWNYSKGRIARVLGSENHVDPSSSPEAVSLFNTAGKNELFYLHNHPSTKKFSFSDVMEFIRFAQIGIMAVVTNQGEVYIMHKSSRYSFEKAQAVFNDVYTDYAKGKINDIEAVDRFLKNCGKGGIDYARSR